MVQRRGCGSLICCLSFSKAEDAQEHRGYQDMPRWPGGQRGIDHVNEEGQSTHIVDGHLTLAHVSFSVAAGVGLGTSCGRECL